MNICLLTINLYNLMRLLKVKNHYELIETTADDGFAAYLKKMGFAREEGGYVKTLEEN